jgi:hypothetical protein
MGCAFGQQGDLRHEAKRLYKVAKLVLPVELAALDSPGVKSSKQLLNLGFGYVCDGHAFFSCTQSALEAQRIQIRHNKTSEVHGGVQAAP